MFEKLGIECEAFYKAHKDWEPYRYIQNNEAELKSFCREMVASDLEIQPLLEDGTMKDMDGLVEFFCKDIVSYFSISMLMSILDELHFREESGRPFSQEFVVWFRQAGWRFPQFQFESLIELSRPS